MLKAILVCLRGSSRKLVMQTQFYLRSTNFHPYIYEARSQGGSLGAEEPPFLNRRSISVLKRSLILA